MEKLYTRERWVERQGRFTNLDTSERCACEPKRVCDSSGRIVTYTYHATGESSSNNIFKRISRIVLGWFLSVVTFGVLKCDPTVAAWMRGRRIDRIYVAQNSQAIKLNSLLTRGSLLEHLSSTAPRNVDILRALEILLFADQGQPVEPILEECFRQPPSQENDSVLRACFKVVELSSGHTFGENAHDDDEIIRLFLERTVRRTFHGTSKPSAKALLQNGVSYRREDKGHDYDELEALIDQCGPDISPWYARSREVEHDNSRSFFVSRSPFSAIVYAQNNGPEWFNGFRKLGGDTKGEFDEGQFRRNIAQNGLVVRNKSFHSFFSRETERDLSIENRPIVTLWGRFSIGKSRPFDAEKCSKHFCYGLLACPDIERVVRFAKGHWPTCCSTSRNAAVLIVEESEENAIRWLEEILRFVPQDPSGFLLDMRSCMKRDYLKLLLAQYYSFLKAQTGCCTEDDPDKALFKTLSLAMAICDNERNRRLDATSSPIPPTIIQAIKVPA
jgi:hypothetical protein